jgi:hypothetical protein
MNRAEIVEFRLKPAMKECALHRKRLHVAWEEASTFAPLQGTSVDDFTEEQVRTLDQLLFRFGKLQDAIGTRLLPAILRSVQEWRDDEPFLDKLNRAEKLGVLPSVDRWQLLRELRNQTAHEYPDQPETARANLRLLVANVPVLEEAHRQMVVWAETRVLAVRY